MKAVFLDTGPLGLVSNPKLSADSLACREWIQSLVDRGIEVYVPEIADYELRRELIRAGKAAGLRRLDVVKEALRFRPITTEAMLRAAQLWATARNEGLPTAPKEALDGDAILAAQALTAGFDPGDIVVATTNVGHLTRFVDARRWRDLA
ncbi:MAG: type II toxin-antitoxin system VapC family toxin [Fimbriimonas sp.]